MKETTRPVFLCIEGLDGSGKTVQCGLLADALRQAGKRVFLIDFPQYESPLGREIGRFLSGKDETANADSVDAKSMCLWYAADRWNALKNVEFSQYDYVIFNRYTLSSAVYQTARRYGGVNEEFIQWVFSLEHGVFGLPEPDAYLFLNTEIAGCAENLTHKGERAYVDGLDLYERSQSLLARCRQIYLHCAEVYDHVHLVPCTGPDGLLPVDVIHRRVMETLAAAGLCP